MAEVTEEFKTEMAKRRALFGSNVSSERIIEIMTASAIPGNHVPVTREEAAACGIDSLPASEVKALFGDNLDELSDEEAYAGMENIESQFYMNKGENKKNK